MAAIFSVDNSFPCQGETVTFTDMSNETNIVSWVWSFGDGSASQLQNPTHSYNDNGTYTVCLTVEDDDGAIDTVCTEITVLNVNPIADFDYIPTNPTILDIITYNDNSSDSDGIIVNWTWDFDDGNTSHLQNPTHQYNEAGKNQTPSRNGKG